MIGIILLHLIFFYLQALADESEKEERQLQDEFRDLVMAIEMYLKPITAQFDGILVYVNLNTVKNNSNIYDRNLAWKGWFLVTLVLSA